RARLPHREGGLGEVRLGGEGRVGDGGQAELLGGRGYVPPFRPRQRLPVDQDGVRTEHDDARDLRVAHRDAPHRAPEVDYAALAGPEPDLLTRSQHRLRGSSLGGFGLGSDGLRFRALGHGMAGGPLDEPLLETRVGLGGRRRDGAGTEQRYPDQASRARDVPTERNHPIPSLRPSRPCSRDQKRSWRVTWSPSSTSTECRGRRRGGVAGGGGGASCGAGTEAFRSGVPNRVALDLPGVPSPVPYL